MDWFEAVLLVYAEATADEMAPIMAAGDRVRLLATQNSSFDTYRAIGLLTKNVDTFSGLKNTYRWILIKWSLRFNF